MLGHKIRNVLDKVCTLDHEDVRDDLHSIMNADTEKAARSDARRFKNRWEEDYPKAVKSLSWDLESCWRYKTVEER